jgi:hypothetical protein
MRHQTGEGKELKKKQKPDAEAGFEAWTLWDRAVASDDIQPANVFDSAQLCVRCRGELATRK